MDGTTKTEISENIPVSKASISFQAIISDMKIFEAESNCKISKLEARLQEAEDTIFNLRKEKEDLKSSLAAKERDCKLYYRQYQNIAQEFEEPSSKRTLVNNRMTRWMMKTILMP